ncbi:hypothetical protein GCM10023199_34470 [Actinomycetospora chibensis]
MACARCGARLHDGDRFCGGCGVDIQTASGGHGPPDSPASRALQECFTTLFGRFEDVYRNPTGVVAVPIGTTSVFVDTEETSGGRVNVSVRGVILQDLPPRPALFQYVAEHAGRYLLGGLYLYPEGDTYDLDRIVRLWHDRTSPDDLIQAVAVVGTNALEHADHLEPLFGGNRINPSGGSQKKLWNPEALARRTDVADALVARLDTQSTAILGAADHVSFMGAYDGRRGDLWEPVYAVTRGGLWVAGRADRGRAPVVRHFAHAQIDRDVMHHEQPPYDYFALLVDQTGVMIQVGSVDEAYAILKARNEAA